MMLNIVLFLVGLGLLLAGGESLVRGAAAIARGMGISPVVVGLTVVAFGTSAPELVVAIVGATTGVGGVAFGNVVGASITNIAFILGIAALLSPLLIDQSIVTRELPMLLLATVAALVVSVDQLLSNTTNIIERSDGLILCLFFSVFLYYTTVTVLGMRRDRFVAEAEKVGWRLRAKAIGQPTGLILFGLAGLGVGGNLLVDAAASIAAQLGMTPAAIGLTIVSLGTTAPELVASVLAVRRGETELAVGNIVGSNIFNILLVLGVASTLSPITVPPRGAFALMLAVALTLVLLILARSKTRRLGRVEGLLLLTIFVAYNLWVVFS